MALGPEPVQGRHDVFIEYEGQKSVVGAVTPGVIEQFQIDFPVMRCPHLQGHAHERMGVSTKSCNERLFGRQNPSKPCRRSTVR